MSFNNHKIKSRKSDGILEYFQMSKWKKFNKKHNLILQNSQNKRKSRVDEKCIKYRNIKKLTIGPLFSTLESTQSSPKNPNEENNSTTQEKPNISLNSKKIILPKDEDTAFLYNIFFKTNHNDLKKFINKKKSDYKDLMDYNKNDNNYINNNNYDFGEIKKYLIKLQKKFIYNENLVIESKNQSSGILKDNYQLQKLDDLISRYILIIHILIRCSKSCEAKKLFLLLVKENLTYINNTENQIHKNYSENIGKVDYGIPKPIYKLSKIYSLLIRYSRFFNINKYLNIFLTKYLKLQLLNYKFFIMKSTNRGFSIEIKNQLEYLLSYCFHTVFFYCVENYLPINIPIAINSNIISLYQNIEENSLTDQEKSLITKSLYNQGVLLYIDNHLDEAMLSFYRSKEKIFFFEDDTYYFKSKKNGKLLSDRNKNQSSYGFHQNDKKDSSISFNLNDDTNESTTSRLDNFRRKTDNHQKGNSRINEIFNNINNSNLSKRKYSIISLDEKNQKSSPISINSRYEAMVSIISENIRKNYISINDIELLVKFGKENMLLIDEPNSSEKKLSSPKNNNKIERFKKAYRTMRVVRNSHIDFHTSIKIKNFNVPKHYKNPLLRNIELFMGLIDLQRKNYDSSYEHILKVLYLIIILKISNNNNEYDKNFINQQKMEIDKYLEMISKSYEKYIKSEKLDKEKNINSDENKESNTNDLVIENNTTNNIIPLPLKNKNSRNSLTKNYKNYKTFLSHSKQNLSNNGSNKIYSKKTILEFQKFFIFLNGLSLYQIKLLNETQPESDKRNNLPIIFANQFKDCLSMHQRRELDNIQSMALSRFVLLKDSDKSIIPSNINISIISENNIENKKNGNIHLYTFDRYNYFDDNFIQTKEYKNYLRIINSRKCFRDIKDYLVKNRAFVIKIIKDLNDEEIKNIIDYPYIIIEPIKQYKKRMKKELKNSKNSKVKNYIDNLLRRNKDFKTMKTVVINSKSMKNQIKREVSKKKNKRNNSIVMERPELKTFIKKRKKNINNPNDSFVEENLSIET